MGKLAEKLNVLMHGTQMRIVFAIIELSLPPPRLPADWMMRREEGEGSAKRLAIKGINNGSVFGFAPGATQQQPLSQGIRRAKSCTFIR